MDFESQVALSYSALLLGKKATVFLNTPRGNKQDPPPLVQLALRLKAVVHASPTDSHRPLRETEEAATRYAAEDPNKRVILPFGLKYAAGHEYFEMFKEAIIEALPINYRPKSHAGGGEYPPR